MNYKKISVYIALLILLALVIIAFFCFLGFSSSYGYSSHGSVINQAVEDFPPVNQITIIIDPGHGGIDPGAVANGLIEKDLNLALGQRLGDFLSISGYTVLFTRTEDTLLGEGTTVRSKKVADLKARTALIENTDNCIFVSLHINKFESQSAKGLQTFYSENNAESRKLAEAIQAASKLLDPENNRRIKPEDGNIFILKNAYKPAVLVECGFISNSSDATKLSSDEYKDKLAFVLYVGIINYLGEAL